MVTIRPGDFNQRIAIQGYTTERNATGGLVKTWATSSTVWGSVKPLKGNERMRAMQVDPTISHVVRMWYGDGSTISASANRLLIGSRVFEIHSVANVEEADVMIEMICSEVL